MKFRFFIQIAVALLIILTVPVVCEAKGWDTNPKTERTDTRLVIKTTEIEIRVARGVILITTNHAVPVKVFTILGQQISSETVPAGTSQYTVSAHGVYIVKAGELTCKVAV